MALLSLLFALTVWTIVSICVQGIEVFNFRSVVYRTFNFGTNGALLPLCFGFLAYGLMLHRSVSGALHRPVWDPETKKLNAVKGKVLKKIVLVVSASTLLWLMRLTMMVIWEVQTNYAVLDAQMNFSGVYVCSLLLALNIF